MRRAYGRDKSHRYCHLYTSYRPPQVSSQPFSLPSVLWAVPEIWSWVSVNAMPIGVKLHCLFGIVLVCMPCGFTSFRFMDFGQTFPVLEFFEIDKIRGAIITEWLFLFSGDAWVVNKHGEMGWGDDHDEIQYNIFPPEKYAFISNIPKYNAWKAGSRLSEPG